MFGRVLPGRSFFCQSGVDPLRKSLFRFFLLTPFYPFDPDDDAVAGLVVRHQHDVIPPFAALSTKYPWLATMFLKSESPFGIFSLPLMTGRLFVSKSNKKLER